MSEHIIELNSSDPRWFVSIYKPHIFRWGDARPRYGLSVSPDCIADPELRRVMDVRQMRKTGEQHVRLSTFYQPEVYDLNRPSMERVKHLLADFDARNVSRDFLFNRDALVISVRTSPWSYEGRSGTMICPYMVGVDA